MTSALETNCCIVGGWPVGMMLGVLLARAGVRTVVLEKHADFLRDFRGDTIHPSTLELMHELGVLDEFLALPHHKASHIYAQFGETRFRVADFTRLPTHCGFIAFMPQWDFLDFLARQGQRYRAFELRMETEVTGLFEEDGRVCGVRASSSEGELEIRADLVIGADGRAVHRTRSLGARSRGVRRPDGRVVVSPFEEGRRSRRSDGAFHGGPYLDHDQPPRSLAVRLRDP